MAVPFIGIIAGIFFTTPKSPVRPRGRQVAGSLGGNIDNSHWTG